MLYCKKHDSLILFHNSTVRVMNSRVSGQCFNAIQCSSVVFNSGVLIQSVELTLR